MLCDSFKEATEMEMRQQQKIEEERHKNGMEKNGISVEVKATGNGTKTRRKAARVVSFTVTLSASSHGGISCQSKF